MLLRHWDLHSWSSAPWYAGIMGRDCYEVRMIWGEQHCIYKNLHGWALNWCNKTSLNYTPTLEENLKVVIKMCLFVFLVFLALNFLLCISRSAVVFDIAKKKKIQLYDGFFLLTSCSLFNTTIQLWKLLIFSGCLYLRPLKGINQKPATFACENYFSKFPICSSCFVEQQWQPAATHLNLAELFLVELWNSLCYSLLLPCR